MLLNKNEVKIRYNLFKKLKKSIVVKHLRDNQEINLCWMGNQCCGQPAEGQSGNYEVNNKEKNGDMTSIAKFENSTVHKSSLRHKIEEINEREVEHKTDFQVGEGATYTGQMKEVKNESGEK